MSGESLGNRFYGFTLSRHNPYYMEGKDERTLKRRQEFIEVATQIYALDEIQLAASDLVTRLVHECIKHIPLEKRQDPFTLAATLPLDLGS